jgi:hypothetical protein
VKPDFYSPSDYENPFKKVIDNHIVSLSDLVPCVWCPVIWGPVIWGPVIWGPVSGDGVMSHVDCEVPSLIQCYMSHVQMS